VVQVWRIGLISWLQPAIFGVGLAILALVWRGARRPLLAGLRGATRQPVSG
jgi:hypothetical protein